MATSDRADAALSSLDLDALGLGEDASRLYRLALTDPDWSTERFADVTGRSAEAARAALDELVSLGLLEPSVEHRGRWVPTPPRVGLGRLIERRQSTLRESEQALARSRLSAQQLIEHADSAQGVSLDAIELLEGRDATTARIAELMQSCRSSQSMVTSLPDETSIARARENDLQMLDRGVEVQLLALAGHPRRSPAVREHLALLSEAGAQVRLLPSLPTRLMIFDGTTALLPIDPEDVALGAIAVHQPGLVSLASALFATSWDQARDLDGAAERDPAEGWQPTDLQLEVVRLLGLGNKDEAIARRVDLSLRSVRRIIGQLSQELDAASRFELGVRCVERGLL